MAFSVILIAPALVAALRASELAAVLSGDVSQWLWAVTAVLAVEVLAGGAMAAHALDHAVEVRGKEAPRILAMGTLTRAIAHRLEASLPTSSNPGPPMPVPHTEPAEVTIVVLLRNPWFVPDVLLVRR